MPGLVPGEGVRGRGSGGDEAERALDRALRLRADHGGRRLAVAEQDQRGDGGDAVALLEFVLLVDVDLDELQVVLTLGRNAVEDGSDGVARAAPFRPEVHEHGLVALEDLLVEGRGRYFEGHCFLPVSVVTKCLRLINDGGPKLLP